MRVAMLVSNAFRNDSRSIKSAASLARSDAQVTVFAWDRSGQGAAHVPGVRVCALGPRSTYGRGLLQLPAYLLFILQVLGRLLRGGYDIVHCHRLDCLCVGALAKILRPCRLVYDAHMPFADRLQTHKGQPGMRVVIAAARVLEGGLLRHMVDWSFVDSPLFAQRLASYARGPVDVLLNVPESVPDSTNSNKGSTFCFGRIGLISEQMGQGVGQMLRVLQGLRAERPALSARLLMVGPIVPAEYAQDIAQAVAPLHECATVSGPVRRDEVAAQYSRLDVSVVIYADVQIGGFGATGSQQKVFESMAHGVPLLIYSNAFMNDVVASAGAGLVLDTCDDDAVLAGLLELAEDPGLRKRLSEAGRRAASERYNWEVEEAKLSRALRGDPQKYDESKCR